MSDPKGTAWRHKRALSKARASFSCSELYTGIHRLAEMPMSFNGLAPDPVFRYKIGDADGTDLPAWDYGETLSAASATGLSFNQGSPLLGNYDDSTIGDGTGYYEASGNTFADITTEDPLLEIIGEVPHNVSSNRSMVGKSIWAGGGYGTYFSSGVQPVIWIDDGTDNSLATITDAALMARTFYHFLITINRNEASANGLTPIYNTTAQTGTDVSASAESITVAAPLRIMRGNASIMAAYMGRLFYVALYKYANWFLAGASGRNETIAVAKSRFAALTSSRPLISYGNATYPSSQGSTSPAYQRKVTSGVTRLWYVGAGFPRFERVLDADSREFVGSLVEGGSTNECESSEALGSLTLDDVTIAATNVVLPDGRTLTTSMVHEDADPATDHYIYSGSVASFTQDVPWSISIYAEKSNRGQFGFLVECNPNALCRFDLDTGLPYDASNCTGHMEDIGDGWYLCWLTTTPTTTAAGGAYCPLAEGSSWTFDGLNQDSVALWGFQIEQASYPSSRIITAGAAVARAADVLRYALVEGSDIGSQMGAVRFRFLAPSFTPGRSHYLWSISDGGAAADMIGIYLDTSGYLNVESAATGGSAGAVQIATNYCDNHIHEVLCSWQEGRLDLWCDGIPGTPDTSVNIPNDIDTMDIGTDEAQANHAGPVLVADWRLYPKYLSGWSK